MVGTLSNLNTETKENLVEAVNEVMGKVGSGGGNVDLSGYVKSVNGVTPDKDGNVKITIPDSSQNVTLTTAQINALDGMFQDCAFIKADISAEYNPFLTAFGISDSGGEEEPDEPDAPTKTLASISAVYSGGDVAVGTAVSDLTGIVVTAHYSDGTSETVTGYTLSGTIAEGENTITVSYGGKTTTITVVGVASGDDPATSNRYEYSMDNPGKIVNNSGGLLVNGLYNTTGFIDVDSSNSTITVAVQVPISDTRTEVITFVQWFIGDECISQTDAAIRVPIGETKNVGKHNIPSGATKFRVSVQNSASKFLLYKGDVSVDNVEF
jgi:hypothetical protein